MTTRHQKIIDYLSIIARDVAPIASARVASAIVYKREIVALGVCQRKTHPEAKRYAKVPLAESLHAEVSCITKAKNAGFGALLDKCTLYVVRQRIIDKEWCLGLAKPCSGCQRCILGNKIKNVIYSLNDFGYGVEI